MNKLNDNLENAKRLLNNKNINDNLYMRLYSFTTENISGYLKYFSLKNKSLLTVGSSGDQILNTYNNGCRDITLIDINPFSKYYINLKIAAILSLNYEEFIVFFFRNLGLIKNINRFNKNLFNKLSSNLKTIDYDSFYFFNRIFNSYNMDKISDYLFNDDQENSKIIKKINNYLNSEESYNKLKKILKDINFKFINTNIFNFSSNLKYDNIFLSNICSVTGILSLKELLNNLSNNNLNNYGSMLIAYLWNTNYDDDEFNIDLKEIYRMPATKSYLKEFITEHYNIDGIYNILFEDHKKNDLVLIYRK